LRDDAGSFSYADGEDGGQTHAIGVGAH
jgi:hypothetical protein